MIQHLFSRFKLICPQRKSLSGPGLVDFILSTAKLDRNLWKVGPSKVFLKELNTLEEIRESALFKMVARIQATWKMFRDRKRFVTVRKSVIKLQSCLRIPFLF